MYTNELETAIKNPDPSKYVRAENYWRLKPKFCKKCKTAFTPESSEREYCQRCDKTKYPDESIYIEPIINNLKHRPMIKPLADMSKYEYSLRNYRTFGKRVRVHQRNAIAKGDYDLCSKWELVYTLLKLQHKKRECLDYEGAVNAIFGA